MAGVSTMRLMGVRNMSRNCAVRLSVALFVLSVLASQRANGGLDHYRAIYGHAWFLEGPVTFCLVRDPDFGVDETFIKEQLAEALETWKRYLKGKRIWDEDLIFNPERSPTEFKWQPCDGTEEVKLFLGEGKGQWTPAEERLISSEKAKYDRPLGFTKMTSPYDLKSHRGKGIVWIAAPHSVVPEDKFPDWGEEDLLQSVLLHELGHILGATHQNGTIMALNFAKVLKERQDYQKKARKALETLDPEQRKFLDKEAGIDRLMKGVESLRTPVYPTHIEIESELVSRPSDPFKYTGRFLYYQKDIFSLLTGRLPVSRDPEKVWDSNSMVFRGKSDNPLAPFTLQISDDRETFRFTVRPTMLVTQITMSHQFVQYLQKDKTLAMDATAMAFLADLEDGKGKKLPVFVTRNMPVQFEWMDIPVIGEPLGESGIFNIAYYDEKKGANRLIFKSAWP